MAQYDMKAFENTVDVWDICGTFGELNNSVHHDNGMVKCATHEISVSTEIKKANMVYLVELQPLKTHPISRFLFHAY